MVVNWIHCKFSNSLHYLVGGTNNTIRLVKVFTTKPFNPHAKVSGKLLYS